ncbi:MAG: hypothetical protein R2825_26490 [Saprospiraceae bacterium]|jgi:hypothetical protein
MKKLFLGTIVLLMFNMTANAQRGSMRAERQEQIDAFKIAFFTEKLQLTPEESKAFWPLFNQFEERQDALQEKYELRGKKLELLSDDEVKGHIMSQLEMEDELVKLRKDYTMQFMEVLPIRKVAMLQRINREFKKALLEEIRKRRRERD